MNTLINNYFSGYICMAFAKKFFNFPDLSNIVIAFY